MAATKLRLIRESSPEGQRILKQRQRIREAITAHKTPQTPTTRDERAKQRRGK